jgi:transcription termination factor Rho
MRIHCDGLLLYAQLICSPHHNQYTLIVMFNNLNDLSIRITNNVLKIRRGERGVLFSRPKCGQKNQFITTTIGVELLSRP